MSDEPTGTPGSSGHLDIEVLADLDEDLLTPDHTASARAHVSGCGTCQQRQADLRSTRALLSTLPADPIPADVATRIDAALAATPRTTIVPLAARRRGWRSHPTAAGLSAAAAVAALVAALVVGRGGHSPSTEDSGSASTAGGAPGASRALALPAPTTSGTNYTDHNLGSTVAALLTPRVEAAQAAPTAPGPATGAGTNGGTAKRAAVPAELTRLFGSAAALTDCVRSVEAGGSGAPVTPLAIDFAHYRGAPVVLVVLPGLEAGNVDAWFVGPECTASDAHLVHYGAVSSSPSTAASPSPGG